MNKQEIYTRVMDIVNSYPVPHKVLNEQNGKVQHIRFDNGIDIWPSTATYKIGSKHYRRDLKGLESVLRGSLEGEPKQQKSQAERIQELEEYVSYLDNELYRIKSFLSL